MERKPRHSQYPFLAGGGEMGELTRSHDWAGTTLGTPDQWPQSLRTTLSIILNSRFPMFLFWGADHLCFYNDAYRVSLGNDGKHPAALGKPGDQVWPEIWSTIKPLIDQVLTTGEATWSEDQLLPIFRNNQVEDVYWTFSYSPVSDESGQPAGVFVTCTETTQKVHQLNQLQASEQRFQNLVREATVGIIVLLGEEMRVGIVNDAYAYLIGRRSDELQGRYLFSIIPEAEAVFRPIIDQVRVTGEPLYLYDQPYFVLVNGLRKEGFLNLVYQPYKEQDGTITGVMVLCQDVTDQKRDQEEKQKLMAVLDASQEFVGLANLNGSIEYVNQAALTMLGWESATDKNIIDCVYPDDMPVAQALLAQLVETGHFSQETRFVNAKTKEPFWLQWNAIAIKDPASGKVVSLATVSPNINDRLKAEQALRETEGRFETMAEASGLLIAVSDETSRPTYYSKAWADLTGRPTQALLTEGWSDLIHPNDRQGNETAYKSAFAEKKSFTSEFRLLSKTGDYRWLLVTGLPRFRPDGSFAGYISSYIDITERKQAEEALVTSEAKLRSLVESAPFPIGVYVGPEMIIQFANQSIIDVWGKGNEVIGKPYAAVLPELAGQGIYEQLNSVYTTGIAFHATKQQVDLVVDGTLQPYYFNYSFTPLYDEHGQVYGVMNTAAGITDLILTQQELERTERSLQGAIELAELATWSMDVQSGTFHYSERFMDWLGFLEATKSMDEAYRPVPNGHRQRVADAIAAVVQPGSDGLYDQEYPIINQLTGQVRIIHAQGKVFTNAQGQPQKLVGTAQDVTLQRQRQQDLEQQVLQQTQALAVSNEQLLAAIRELATANEELASTNEELATSNEELAATNDELAESNELLGRSNENLQQFAYIASHDLQEPLRKIQQFGNLLEDQYGEVLGEGVGYLQRMQLAAGRMSTLIQDLLAFSRISTRQDSKVVVSLNEVVSLALTDLEMVVQDTGAVISVGTLPTVLGDASQLGQLFGNLLSNALKFRQPDVVPIIRVTAHLHSSGKLPPSVKPTRPASAYHRIVVSDNGIGFEEQYTDRIFQVFQRLHGKSQYAGTGIGLAICDKVVANHGGAITATSTPGKGSTFTVYLPI